MLHKTLEDTRGLCVANISGISIFLNHFPRSPEVSSPKEQCQACMWHPGFSCLALEHCNCSLVYIQGSHMVSFFFMERRISTVNAVCINNLNNWF